MAVLRIHKKNKNFVILDKTCLNDDSLSWGAKGIHAYLLSLPDDWQVRVSDLQTRAKNGRDAVRALLSELEHAGYIQKSINRSSVSGRFDGLEYLVLEVPELKNTDLTPATEKPSSDSASPINPEPGNPYTVNPARENPTLLNNKDNNNLNNNNTHRFSNLPQRKLKKPIAQDFYPCPKTLEKALALGYSFATDLQVIQEFIAKNQSWGSEFSDFNPVYLRFLAIHNEHKKQQQKAQGQLRSHNERGTHQSTFKPSALEQVSQHHGISIETLWDNTRCDSTYEFIEGTCVSPLDETNGYLRTAIHQQAWS